MLPVQRYEQIKQYLQDRGTLSVHDLVELLGVSRETVRRDIQHMQDAGMLQKVYGGAQLAPVAEEKTYSQRVVSHADHKVRIGRTASSSVSTGDAIFIDSGTTCLELVRALPVGMRIQAFTNSLSIANELVERQITTYILGGLVRVGELSVSGAIAQSVATTIHVDTAFFGAGGISVKRGIMDYHLEEAALRKTIAERANEVMVLADSSKLGSTALVSVFDWREITRWITDDNVDAKQLEAIEEAGGRVQVIAPHSESTPAG